MMKYIIGLLALVAGISSCSPRYSYFTESLRTRHQWTQDEIRKIQFYVSKDIVLTRTLASGETRIQEGKILIKDGKKIEQVVVRSGTPGVLVMMPRDDRFAISFESADQDAYLMFGPNPKYSNRYALLAQDWSQTKGKVHYRGILYDAPASSALASLMVDLRSIGDHQYKSRTVKGR